MLAVLIIVLLLSAGSLSFGAFLSNFVTTEFQVMQLNPVVTFPQTILSGAWVPIQSIPDWLRPLSYIFPLTYACDALKLTLLKRGVLRRYTLPGCGGSPHFLFGDILHGNFHDQEGDSLMKAISK